VWSRSAHASARHCFQPIAPRGFITQEERARAGRLVIGPLTAVRGTALRMPADAQATNWFLTHLHAPSAMRDPQ
jgi:hypothetical protein